MKLSYSSISTYELCPLKWRFQYLDRLPRLYTSAKTARISCGLFR